MAPANPFEARVIHAAETLLLEHGLFGWSVVLDNAKGRAGQCHHGKKQISFSRALMKVRPHCDSLMTVKHEVAHAIVGAGHHHDAVWKKKFIELGGTGERSGVLDSSSAEKVSKYVATCPDGHKYYKHRQVDDRIRRCSQCPDRPVVEYVEIDTGQPMVRPRYVPRRRRRPSYA